MSKRSFTHDFVITEMWYVARFGTICAFENLKNTQRGVLLLIKF